MGSKVKELKQSVQNKTKVQIKDFKLSFDGVELTDDDVCLQGSSLKLTRHIKLIQPSADYKIVMGQTLTMTEPHVERKLERNMLSFGAAPAARSMAAMTTGWCPPPPAPGGAPSKSRSAVLGIAPGGSINQKIVRDVLPIKFYDQSPGGVSRLYINIFNSSMCGDIGLPVPETPVGPESYLKAGLPWFDLYEEHVPAVKLPEDSALKNLKSVNELEKEKRAKGDSTAQIPCGYCTHQLATVELVPCSHFFCDDCLEGVTVCPAERCGMRITSRRIVGAAMGAPGREEKLGLGPNDPRVVKLKRVAGTGRLICFEKEEDNVYGLCADV
jgi:hypothetical protein